MVTSGAGEGNSFDFTQDKLLIPSRWIPPAHANGELVESRAGEGNRTLVSTLEKLCSAIELHPRVLSNFITNRYWFKRILSQGRNVVLSKIIYSSSFNNLADTYCRSKNNFYISI